MTQQMHPSSTVDSFLRASGTHRAGILRRRRALARARSNATAMVTAAASSVARGTLTGSIAAWNFVTGRRVRPLPAPFAGEQGTFEWRGHRVAYTRTGEGAPVILVHGLHVGAWSHEWRQVAEGLARHHTVYALDLLGFGRSDRPALRYTAALYVSLLDDFARRVVGEPAALVASARSAACAIALGARDVARFPALALVAPTGLTQHDTPRRQGSAKRSLFGDVVATPLLGHTTWNALVTHASLRDFLRASYADKSRVTTELVETYWQATHQRGARHASASLMGHLLDLDVREPLRRLSQPTLVLWGEQAAATPVDEIRPFMATRRDFQYVILDPAGDVPHDERPGDVTRLLTEFLDRAGHKPRQKTEPRRVA